MSGIIEEQHRVYSEFNNLKLNGTAAPTGAPRNGEASAPAYQHAFTIALHENDDKLLECRFEQGRFRIQAQGPKSNSAANPDAILGDNESLSGSLKQNFLRLIQDALRSEN